MRRSVLILVSLLFVGGAGLSAQRGSAVLTRPTFVPIAPSGVSVSGRAPQVTVTWQPVTGAVDYVVVRTQDPAQPPSPISPAPLTVASFVDPSAVAGQTYYYAVTARYAGGLTATSAQVQYVAPVALVKSGLPHTRFNPAPPTPGVVTGVTSVSDTVVAPGGPTPTIIRGNNLWDVTGVYFGTGAPGSSSNRKIVPSYVSTTGDEVRFTAPTSCMQHGPLLLEQYAYAGASSSYIDWIPAAGGTPSPFRLYCIGRPIVSGPPQNVHSGSVMFIRGSSLSWVKQVTDLAHGGAAMTFTVTDDTELRVYTPSYTSMQVPSGQVVIQPSLISPGGSTSMSPIVVYLPPRISSAAGPVLSPGQVTPVEPGGNLIIAGYGFANPVVTIDGVVTPVLSGSNNVMLSVQVPASATSGSFQVGTLGGYMAGTYPMMTGPTVLSAVSPAAASVGGQITITGVNLFRARGVCFTSASIPPPGVLVPEVPQWFTVGPQAPSWQSWTNTSVTVVVPPNIRSGPIGLEVALRGGSPYCVMGGVSLVVQ